MLDFVLSVETIEIDTSGLTTASGILTKGQDYTNCVPFSTHEGDSNDLNTHFFDIYFEEGAVYVDSTASSTNGTVILNVVEFDPSKVNVTQGTFSMSAIETNVTISEVVVENTFVVSTWKVDSTSTTWTIYAVKAYLESSTNLEFKRNILTDSLSGHYYLVECLNNEFYVQHIDTVAVSEVAISIPTAIDMNRSFLISTYYTINNNQYSDRNVVMFYFYNSNFLYSRSAYRSGNIYSNCQVIEFSHDSKKYVSHISPLLFSSNTDYTFIGNLPLDFIGSSNLTFHTSTSNQGLIYTSSTTGAESGTAFYTVTQSGTDAFIASRLVNGFDGAVNLQIIDWDGVDLTVNGTATSIDNPFVKSIEHVQVSFDADFYEFYKYVPLTKDQDYTQCVPFYTVSGPGDYQHVSCAIDIVDGPLLNISRAEGLEYSCYLNIEVVEFYSDTVYVEKGAFGTNTTVITPTISGVESLNNSFLQFNYLNHITTGNSCQAFLRGMFVDSNTLEFRTQQATVMQGYYYVVEFLNGDVDVYSSSYNDTRIFETDTVNRTAPVSKCIPIVSYYAPEVNTHIERAGTLYDHTFPFSSISDRYYPSSNLYTSEFLLTAPDAFYVEKVYYYMDATTTSGVATLSRPVNYGSTLILNSTQTVATYAQGTTIPSHTGAFTKIELSEDGTKLYYNRTPSASIGIQKGMVYVVDWGHALPIYDGPYRGANKGLINSIEEGETTLQRPTECISLSKNQRPAYCVPMANYKCLTLTSVPDKNCLVDVVDSTVYFYRSSYTPLALDVKYTILEFNPAEANVYKYYFYLDKTSSTTITIDSVNINKSFIIINNTNDYTNDYHSASMCRVSFLSNTSVEVRRGASNEYVWGVVYVVEAIDDAFSVVHDNINFSTSPYKFSTDTTFNMLYLTSAYWTETNNYTARSSYVIQPIERDVVFSRLQATGTLYIALQAIKFKESSVSKVYNLLAEVYDTTLSGSFLFNNPNPVDVNRSIVLNTNLNFMSALENISVYHDENTATIPYLLTTGSGVYFERWSGSTYDIQTSYAAVEFNIPTCYFEGVVKEDSTYVDRQVVLFRRSNNQMVDSVMSSGTLGYRLESPYSNEYHYIVCLDDLGGIDYNALITDRAIGTDITLSSED